MGDLSEPMRCCHEVWYTYRPFSALSSTRERVGLPLPAAMSRPVASPCRGCSESFRRAARLHVQHRLMQTVLDGVLQKLGSMSKDIQQLRTCCAGVAEELSKLADTKGVETDTLASDLIRVAGGWRERADMHNRSAKSAYAVAGIGARESASS